MMDNIVITDSEGLIIATAPTMVSALTWMHYNPKTPGDMRYVYDQGKLVQLF